MTNDHRSHSLRASLVGIALVGFATACGASEDSADEIAFRYGSSTTYGSTGDSSTGSSSGSSSSTGSTSGNGSSTGGSGSSDGSSSGGDDCLAGLGLSQEDLTCEAGSSSGTDGTTGGTTGGTGGSACDCEDPCELVPVEDDNEVTCYSYTQTCQIINGITVCDNEFIPGEYVCSDFTNDFCQECTEAGVPSWYLSFGCRGYRNIHACLGYEKPFRHATAIVEVDYPGTLRKFCIVEPQNNVEVVCWIGGEDPQDDLPSHVVDGLHDYYDSWGYQDCIDDGWTPHMDVL